MLATKRDKAALERSSTVLLRAAIVVFALSVLAICIFVLPAGITTDKTGYYRPILIGMYLPTLPFFYGLLQAWRFLGYIDNSAAFSVASVDALKKIKYAALTVSGMYAVGMPFIFNAADRDDAPGVVVIGLVLTGAPFVIALAAAVFQRLVQNAVDIKSENELTV